MFFSLVLIRSRKNTPIPVLFPLVPTTRKIVLKKRWPVYGNAENRISNRVGRKTNSMRNIILCIIQALVVTQLALAQSDEEEDYGNYCRENIALTQFRLLGVDEVSYAKCVSSENFLEPGRRLPTVNIDGTLYVDDGTKNDLVAGDGVMTSVDRYKYESASQHIQPGQYQPTGPDNYVVDEAFRHSEKVGEAGRGLIISCRFRWVRCRDMPQPDRFICFAGGWPYGSFQLVECTFGF